MKRLFTLALLLLACGQPFAGAHDGDRIEPAGGSSSAGVAGGGGVAQGGQDAGGRAGELVGAGMPAGGELGAGGAPGASEGGSGGVATPEPTAVCLEHPTPPASSWAVTTSPEGSGEPGLAVDGLPETRWSSEAPQAGNEWLQVDFGASVALSGVVVSCCVLTQGYPESLEDYGRRLELRVSDAPQDFAAVPVAAGPGFVGGTAFSFPPTVGRYLLISQTATQEVNWWSVHEIIASCE